MKKYIVELDIPERTSYVQIKYYPWNKENTIVVENKAMLDEDFLDRSEFKEVIKIDTMNE
jgi:hypothetical protein